MENYQVTIRETSMQLTAKERIKYKDTSNATKLDSLIDDNEKITIAPVGWIVLDVHNEKGENPDYQQFVIVGENGEKYVTGSKSFWSAFINIWNEMKSESESEDFEIEVYKLDSKNYKGKKFMTCSII